MGYYTKYELDTFNEIADFESVYNDLMNFLDSDSCGSPFEESCKWYEHEEDMRKFSKKYPKIIFLLKGEGEQSGDIWRKYFKNGKMQECKAKITFDDFNEEKLQ